MGKLLPVCTYQGGKQRLSDKIVDIISNEKYENSEIFYELCCGSGAVSLKIVENGVFQPEDITMVDSSMWGGFWREVGKGYNIDSFIKEKEKLPHDKSDIKDYLKNLSLQEVDYSSNNRYNIFLLLQAGAFGGKPVQLSKDKNYWDTCSFRNYWTPTEFSKRRSPVNPMMPMPDTMHSRLDLVARKMKNVNGVEGDINDIISFENNSVIYIDPPYQDTSGYGDNNVDIYSYLSQIRSTCKLQRKKVKIFVSEGFPLDGANKIWQLSGKRDKGGINGNRKTTNEEWLSMIEVDYE